MPDKNITFEIQEHFGVIGKREGWNKELNLIRWNGGAVKFDIREWDEHHERMSKGLTLSQWEMRKVVDLYISRNNDAAVARGRAIEAERNARRIAARQKAEAAAAEAEQKTDDQSDEPTEEQEELDALEGAMPPSAETQNEPESQEEMEEPF